ncbi:MAG: DegT/DnrJ/EryC1/StrS family aminotransferase [Opitutaceae bacterium]
MSTAPIPGQNTTAPPVSPAILGGEPAFPGKLHVGRPNLGNRDRLQARIDAILDSNWLTNDGPMVRELEQAIAAKTGVKNCVATCNGTMALMLAAHALELSGEVILPSFTFIATAHALRWLGITPVFCDIDPETHNIDPDRIEALITDRTSAIMGVHLWGRPSPTASLDAIAKRHGLKLLYDAAHAFGVSHQGRMIGSFGDAEVFSFHATKYIHSFEGGAVVTTNEALAEKMRLMRNFGFSGVDKVTLLGINAKMPEVCAAMGLTSLESIGAFIGANRRNDEAYREELRDFKGIAYFDYPEGCHPNFQYAICEVDPSLCPLTRDELVTALQAEGVLARRYFYPGCHRMEPYASRATGNPEALPQTDRVGAMVMALPTGCAVTPSDVAKIGTLLRTILAQAPAIRERLAR